MRRRLEVADIFRRHGAAYRRAHAGHLSRANDVSWAPSRRAAPRRWVVMSSGVRSCGLVRIAYNSCRNRHCPKCQGLARAEWLADRQAELLPVPYFHVVFTVPAPIAEIAFQNKAVVYGILFKAAAETLRTIAADPKHLGAEIGFVAVLHTWGQTLQHHPHIHCVVPGGGVSPDGDALGRLPTRLLPARELLSRLYRRLFLDSLQAAFDAGQLRFFANLAALDARRSPRLKPLHRMPWVVYAKRPFGGPEQVLAYLGRYTHRVAIANSRLIELTADRVTFRWKDYRQNDKPKAMTLDADEFIRRFLLHVLPDGFHRIRHYGYLANGHRTAKLALCRELLAVAPVAPLDSGDKAGPPQDRGFDTCPCCGGRMEVVGPLPRPRPANPSAWHDSS